MNRFATGGSSADLTAARRYPGWRRRILAACAGLVVASVATSASAGPVQVPFANTTALLLDEAGPLVLRPDPVRLAVVRKGAAPEGNWGGPGCPTADELRSLVDAYLATPHPDHPGKGSTVPGLSISLSSKGCGVFVYAAGIGSLERNEPLTPAWHMKIASMTKPVLAALTLKLDEAGRWGSLGLDTPVASLLTPEQITALTVGTDPARPRCPGSTFMLNRVTLSAPWTRYECPDLSRVTLRHLMLANHGMYDIISELRLRDGSFPYYNGIFSEIDRYLGTFRPPPVSARNGYPYLAAFGLKQNLRAEIGGNRQADFEVSFGNTGFQLLGVILEQQTGLTLDSLIRLLITEPLGIGEIRLYLDPFDPTRQVTDGYDAFPWYPEVTQAPVYPLLDLNGHTVVNVASLGLGLPPNVTLAGGAGGLLTTPATYRDFFEAFTTGKLLGPKGRQELERSFIRVPHFDSETVRFFNGFGLFKQRIRSDARFPDMDFRSHGGNFPGSYCLNGAAERIDGLAGPLTLAMCVTSNYIPYPRPNDLANEILVRVLGPPAPR